MKRIKLLGNPLTKEQQKKIFAGSYTPPAPYATCKNDCGGGENLPVTCTGISCTTTSYGCYAQLADSSLEYKRCLKPAP